MSSSTPLVLYDIAADHQQPFSPNCWKVRFALNIKKLPYKTTFVHFRDIESTCLAVNASPTIKPDGSSRYTLPVLHDPSTGRTISDSWQIVKYLDETYPQTHTLLPDGSWILQRTFISTFEDNFRKIAPMMFAKQAPKFDEGDRERYCQLVESSMGKKFSEIAVPPGTWEGIEKWFDKLDGYYQEGDGPFVMGKELSLADLCVAGSLMWLRRILGEEGDEWRAMRGWNGGRWARLADWLKEYETVI